jgi:hypothetical protein
LVEKSAQYNRKIAKGKNYLKNEKNVDGTNWPMVTQKILQILLKINFFWNIVGAKKFLSNVYLYDL